jgi:hypothetical protein
VVGLTALVWVAAEMHLGRPIELPLERNAFVRVGSGILSAAAFLFFIWWMFREIRRVKKSRS